MACHIKVEFDTEEEREFLVNYFTKELNSSVTIPQPGYKHKYQIWGCCLRKELSRVEKKLSEMGFEISIWQESYGGTSLKLIQRGR
jgi:hypothetical protein